MTEQTEVIYENTYFTVHRNGKLSLSDGVGYLDTLNKEETHKLYLALHTLFKKEN